MIDEEHILQQLKAAGITVVGAPARDPAQQDKVYVFVEVSRNKRGQQKPSTRTINVQAKLLAEQGVKLEAVIVDEGLLDVEASVKTLLFKLFPDLVRNAFVSRSAKEVAAWIEPKIALNDQQEKEMQSKLKDLLAVMETPLESIRFTSLENVPTKTACLHLIRLKSPVSSEALVLALKNRRFHVPSEAWLSKRLDALRKSHLVLRKANGQFVVTLAGLKALGSGKGRSSPDVRRALDLARRGP